MNNFKIIETGRILTPEESRAIQGGGIIDSTVICPVANTYRSCPDGERGSLVNCSMVYDVTYCAKYTYCGNFYYNCSNYPSNYQACPGALPYQSRN